MELKDNSLSAMWTLGIELRWAGLVTNTFPISSPPSLLYETGFNYVDQAVLERQAQVILWAVSQTPRTLGFQQ